jgi:hypothetical protein
VELFDATNGTQWTRCSGNRLDPCGACGNTCTGQHITRLGLASASLQGSLPTVIKDFTEVTTLYLDNNALNGPIPKELACLTKLKFLQLEGNTLTGLVPALPWDQYTDENTNDPSNGCWLQNTNSPTNRFACPLPVNSSQCKGGPPTCTNMTTTTAPTTTHAPMTTTAPTAGPTAAPPTPVTSPTSRTGTDIAIGCAVAAACAAAMCFYSRRQNTKRARRGGDGDGTEGLKEPLLMTSVSDSSGGATRDNVNTGGGGSAQPPAEPVEEAEYDEDTGAPINMTAKRDVAREWNSAALSGEKSRVVDLPYAELERATDCFSEFNMVGGGASCAVFVARVFGVTAAIKQLKDATVEWEAKQFTSEMALLQRASHANICRLLAFSSDGPHRCLVLELCSGGALNERLACKVAAGRAPPAPLTWQERVRIAHGIASALEYLHGLTPQMIHRCVGCTYKCHEALVSL